MTIPPGSYQWRRYRLEGGTAQKRRLYNQLTWWFGGFYGGKLDQDPLDRRVEPDAAFHCGIHRRAGYGTAPVGDFTTTLVGNRLRINSRRTCRSPATCSTTPTANRLGPTRGCAGHFGPLRDLFIVYNHNVRSILDRWQLDSNQFLVKVQYALRY